MTLTCPHCSKRIPLEINPALVRLLTPSQLEVVQAKMSRGECNKELAARLNTTEQAIKNRLRKAYQSLGVHSDIEMTVLWFRNIVAQCPNPKSGQAA
jgi:DNA-binding NarL/FixJ family response regulator